MRKVGIVLAFVVPIAVVAVMFWKDAAVWYWGYSAEWQFTQCYANDKEMMVDRPAVDWAIELGGRSGLGRAKRLKENPQIKEIGRMRAAEVCRVIEKREYLEAIRSELKGNVSGGTRRALLEYILQRDGP